MMSQELAKYKGTGKSTTGCLAGTIHPGESASQLSSNLLYEEGQEAGGDAAKRIAIAKAKQEADANKSRVSTNSRALMTHSRSSQVGSSTSRASSARSASGLMVEDITSDLSGPAHTVSKSSDAVAPVNKALEAIAGSSSKSSSRRSSSRSTAGKSSLGTSSSVSNVSSTKASAVPGSSVSHASGNGKRQLAIEGPSSQVSRASGSRSTRSSASAPKEDRSMISRARSARGANSSLSSASKSSASTSQISGASDGKGKSRSSISSSSRTSSRANDRSRALVPVGQTEVRASPLRNEVRVEDLNDDMYSISIHERGVLQELPSRAEMLEMILKENPHLDTDEATAIADNRIATSSAVGRSQIVDSIAPASMISRAERSAVSRASTSKGKEVFRPSRRSILSAASSSRSRGYKVDKPSSVVSAASAKSSSSVSKGLSHHEDEVVKIVSPSTLSKASNFESKNIEIIRPQSVVSSASAKPVSSHISKAPSYYDRGIVQGIVHAPSELLSAPPALTRSSTAPASLPGSLAIANFSPSPGSSLTIFKMPDGASETAISDLLALAQLRQQSEARRAQAMRDFQAQHDSAGSDLAQKRMIELEIAKQALADSQLESQMQEFSIQTSKLADLQRHAHEDRVAALERAQAAENRRKADSMIDAIRDRTATEKARNRDRRGDIARAAREREDERNSQLQKEFERIDRDRTNETLDTWERLVEASRPRDSAQPRRTNVELEHSHQYRNPQTGGNGTVKMRIHKGCKGKGDGVCPDCGLEYLEHPVRQQRDGSIITRTGRRIMPGEKGDHPEGSAVSKTSSSRRN